METTISKQTITLSRFKARKIMGQNVFGVEEAMRHFGVRPTEDELAALAHVPYCEETLRACRKTHILVAVFPLSISQMRKLVKRRSPITAHGFKDYRVALIEDKGNLRWRLICTNPNAMDESLETQIGLLGYREERVTTRELVYIMTGWFLETRKKLFVEEYPEINLSVYHAVRSSELARGPGGTFSVGFLDDAPGCLVGVYNDLPQPDLGLASARKSDY